METSEEYFIAQDSKGFGNVLALRSPWRRALADAIARHGVKVIRLSEYNGWSESDVSFLREIPFIEGVEILSDKVTDVRPIVQLKKLKTLALTCRAKTPVDLASLQNLKSVFLTWRKAYESIFAHDQLVRINIVDYPNKDLTIWRQNNSLDELLIASKQLEGLLGIERFRNLKRLDLFNCRRLHSLRGLEQATCVQTLELDKCTGIGDLKAVSSLADLRELAIKSCGDIRSVAPLAKCTKMEFLQIAGNTTILDGDLSCLTTLQNLKKVLLVPRNHYSPRAENLERG